MRAKGARAPRRGVIKRHRQRERNEQQGEEPEAFVHGLIFSLFQALALDLTLRVNGIKLISVGRDNELFDLPMTQ